MVNEKIMNSKKYYQCGICKFYYKEERLAKKCQNWCKEHNSCNIKITKHAVQL
ncbi:hypothetical protein HYX19_01170 [Candidatus Woesearchaeota archaeon]|nr:hypothetical protein [Candidatus Woesearchaeota archaeon]